MIRGLLMITEEALIPSSSTYIIIVPLGLRIENAQSWIYLDIDGLLKIRKLTQDEFDLLMDGYIDYRGTFTPNIGWGCLEINVTFTDSDLLRAAKEHLSEDPKLNTTEKIRRAIEPMRNTMYSKIYSKIYRIVSALRLLSEKRGVGIGEVWISTEQNKSRLMTFPPDLENECLSHIFLRKDFVEETITLDESFIELFTNNLGKKGGVDEALRRFNQGYNTINVPERIFCYVNGLEAMFVKTDSGISSNLQRRVARYFVESDDNESKQKRRQIKKEIREAFDIRSEVGHGSKIKTNRSQQRLAELSNKMESYLKGSIRNSILFGPHETREQRIERLDDSDA